MSIDPSRIIETERNLIKISPKKLTPRDRILDIGGGGEGIISRIYKESVIAIDNRLDELNEINETLSLKIVMDATKLNFIDNQFDKATAFFSFMYISDLELKKVIPEVYRVLKVQGSFEIWDIEMPSIKKVEEDIFIAQLEVNSDEFSITTGYGVQLKEQDRTANYYKDILIDSGFRVSRIEVNPDKTIYIEVIK